MTRAETCGSLGLNLPQLNISGQFLVLSYSYYNAMNPLDFNAVCKRTTFCIGFILLLYNTALRNIVLIHVLYFIALYRLADILNRGNLFSLRSQSTFLKRMSALSILCILCLVIYLFRCFYFIV